MKLKPNIRLREVRGEYILFPDNRDKEYTSIISLNESAAYLLEESMEEPFTKEEWAQRLMDRYQISPERAERDVEALLDKLEKVGLLIP